MNDKKEEMNDKKEEMNDKNEEMNDKKEEMNDKKEEMNDKNEEMNDKNDINEYKNEETNDKELKNLHSIQLIELSSLEEDIIESLNQHIGYSSEKRKELYDILDIKRKELIYLVNELNKMQNNIGDIRLKLEDNINTH
jgi:hypothetical protein